MNLSKDLKSKLFGYFTQKLGMYKYRKNWYKTIACPYCGRENKFGINISLNMAHCFRCGEHPSLIQLVMYLENTSEFKEVLDILNKPSFEGYVFKEEKLELKESKPIYLPEGFKNIAFGNSTLAKSARNYIIKRGFNIDKISSLGWGYGTKGKYFGYIIIPFYDNNKLVYYNARLFIGNGPKYNNPETSITGIGKSYILYNKDALETYKTVYVCEGAINAQTIGDMGIASGGKAISRYQIDTIIKSSCKKVVILFDPDAKDRAINLALKLVDFKKVKVVFLPENKDVNDLGKSETMKLVYSTHYQSYSELLRLKTTIFINK